MSRLIEVEQIDGGVVMESKKEKSACGKPDTFNVTPGFVGGDSYSIIRTSEPELTHQCGEDATECLCYEPGQPGQWFLDLGFDSTPVDFCPWCGARLPVTVSLQDDKRGAET